MIYLQTTTALLATRLMQIGTSCTKTHAVAVQILDPATIKLMIYWWSARKITAILQYKAQHSEQQCHSECVTFRLRLTRVKAVSTNLFIDLHSDIQRHC